jgi:hypothetical protein
MERTDWLDEARARPMPLSHADRDHPPHVQFAGLGQHEVRKLHAELAELDQLVTLAVAPGSARITRTK